MSFRLRMRLLKSRIHPYSSDSVNELIFGSNVMGSNSIENDWCVIPTMVWRAVWKNEGSSVLLTDWSIP
jgi:hypothetical protein